MTKVTSISFLLLLVAKVSAFGVYHPISTTTTTSSSSTRLASEPFSSSSGGGGGDGMGQVETIEFKIYSDGRVEEVVRGVKGNNCHSLTKELNEKLGKVVSSEPTEEMYETKLTVDETLKNNLGSDDENSWDGASSW